jgi:hypothetical protein
MYERFRPPSRSACEELAVGRLAMPTGTPGALRPVQMRAAGQGAAARYGRTDHGPVGPG